MNYYEQNKQRKIVKPGKWKKKLLREREATRHMQTQREKGGQFKVK